MPKNSHTLAIRGFDKAECKPREVWQLGGILIGKLKQIKTKKQKPAGKLKEFLIFFFHFGAKDLKISGNLCKMQSLQHLSEISHNSCKIPWKNQWKMTNLVGIQRFVHTIHKTMSLRNCAKLFKHSKQSVLRGAKECRSCRSRKMLQNASFLVIVAVVTEENGPFLFFNLNPAPTYICV